MNDFAGIERFGTLFLDVRAARQGERIYIPGHGDAAPKRLSIFDGAQNGAGYTNQGVKIDLIYREISSLIDNAG